jgi:tetratricopeptide (TPR) repeat protein
MSTNHQPEKARKWFEETRKLHFSASPDLPKVVAGYRKSLDFNPNDLEVIYHLGLALLGAGKLTEASSEFRKALRAKPDMAEAWYHLGHCLLRQQRADEAEESFRKAVDATPRERRAPLYFALAAAQQTQVQQHLAKGDQAAAKKKLTSAEECYRLGLELQPEDPTGVFQFAVFLQNMASISHEQAPLDESAELLDTLLKSHPEHRDAMNFRSLVHLQKGETEKAEEVLQGALKVFPKDAGLLFNLAQANERAGNTDQARANLEASLEVQPRQPGALGRLAGLIANIDKDYDKALDLIAKGQELAPKDPVLYFQKALIFKTQADGLDAEAKDALREDALALVRRAVELNPGFREAQALLAELDENAVAPAAAKGMTQESAKERIEVLKKQLEEKADETLTRELLGLHLLLRQFDEALPLIDTLLTLHPDDQKLLLNRGLVLSYTANQDPQKMQEARKNLRSAIEAQPDVEGPARLRLAQLDIMVREPDTAALLLKGLREEKNSRIDPAQLAQLSGVAMQQKGRLAEAAAFFKEARKELLDRQAKGQGGTSMDSALRETLGSLSQAYEQLGELDTAIEVCEGWHAQLPKDVLPLQRLVTLYNRKKEYEQGLDTLRKLDELEPDNARTQFFLALTLIDLDKPTEAESCLMRALEIQADFPEAQQRLQYLQNNRPLVAASVEELEQSVADDPEDLDDRLLLSQAYLSRKEWAKASEQLEHIAANDDKNHRALFELASAYQADGEVDKAIDCMIRLEERLPADANVRFRLAEMLFDNEEIDLSIKEYKNAVDMAPANALFQFRYGVALRESDHDEKAEKCIRKAIDLQDRFSAAHYELGMLEYTSSRSEAALKSFITAYNQDPQNYMALYYCGLIQTNELQKPAEAKKFFQSSLGIQPKHGDSHYRLACIFKKAEQIDDARFHLEEALKNWSDEAFLRKEAEEMLASISK